MLDRIFQIVKMLLNTEARGDYSPSDFNRAINLAIDKVVDSYIFEINQAANRANRGLSGTGYENLPERIREKIGYLLTDSSDLVYDAPSLSFALPSDTAWLDTIFYNTTVEVENCKNAKEFRAIQNYVQAAPSEQYPISLRNGNTIKILPISIISGVNVSYLRRPPFARWTYLVISGAEVYNPSAIDFQEVDLHESEFYRLVVLVLSYFGLNLKEIDVTNFAMTLEGQEQEEPNNL